MSIADEIKSIRVKCLLSQVEFANELGISFSTVNRWENGKAYPNYQTLKKIKIFCDNNNIAFDIDLHEWNGNRASKEL